MSLRCGGRAMPNLGDSDNHIQVWKLRLQIRWISSKQLVGRQSLSDVFLVVSLDVLVLLGPWGFTSVCVQQDFLAGRLYYCLQSLSGACSPLYCYKMCVYIGLLLLYFQGCIVIGWLVIRLRHSCFCCCWFLLELVFYLSHQDKSLKFELRFLLAVLEFLFSSY